MDEEPLINEVAISRVGALLADPARAAIVVALCGEHALPAGELAVRASISASTASIHLNRLMEAGWIGLERHGRHHYYRLTSPQVAMLLQQAMSVAATSTTPSTLSVQDKPARASQPYTTLHTARTCYDHLAGKLGVALTGALMQQGALEIVDKDFILTGQGKTVLQRVGVDVATAAKQRRAFAPRCLDWTERRDHLGGSLGATICRAWLEHGWVQREEKGRALQITRQGVSQMSNWGIDWTPSR